MRVTVRPAAEADLPAITCLDLTYPTDRVLHLERSGQPPEHTFALRWRNRIPAPMAVYATYTFDRLREALSQANVFLVAEVDGDVAGLLVLMVPEWSDAAEITDLAVDIAFRRLGAGRALVEAAAAWARERARRALWVEPRGGQPRGDLVLCLAGLSSVGPQRPALFERRPRRREADRLYALRARMRRAASRCGATASSVLVQCPPTSGRPRREGPTFAPPPYRAGALACRRRRRAR